MKIITMQSSLGITERNRMTKWADPIFSKLNPCFDYLRERGWTPGVAKEKTRRSILYVEDVSNQAPVIFMLESTFTDFIRKKGQIDSFYLFYCINSDSDIIDLSNAINVSGLSCNFIRYQSKNPHRRPPKGFVPAHNHRMIEVNWEGVI